MKNYTLAFAFASLTLLAHSAIAAPGSDDVFQYDVTLEHHVENRIDQTQQMSLSTKLGQKGIFESLTRSVTPVSMRVGDETISRDVLEGLSFSILPGYVDAEGGITSMAQYKVWAAGALVTEVSHTFRQAAGERYALPNVGGYEFTVKVSK